MTPLRPAVFIDKDGTLVEDVPYNVDAARVRFAPRALQGLRRLAQSGYLLVVVSNQSGIGLGRFTREAFDAMRSAMQQRVRRDGGVALDHWYVCPHAPAGPGRAQCFCRKPAPGLLRQAALDHRIDLGRSWMVGDILDDVEAGHRAGCRSVLVDVGNETRWQGGRSRRPDVCCGDLDAAARAILQAAGARTMPADPWVRGKRERQPRALPGTGTSKASIAPMAGADERG